MIEKQVRVKDTAAENEKQVRENIPHAMEEQENENEKRVRGAKMKLKTRCYYTDYVNHAIRFFLTTPETLKIEGKRRADIDNWCAVQAVFHCLRDEDRAIIEKIYRSNYKVVVGVKEFCEQTGTDERKVWTLITKTSAAIAKRRGLI